MRKILALCLALLLICGSGLAETTCDSCSCAAANVAEDNAERFILRDCITWDSTIDEVKACFDEDDARSRRQNDIGGLDMEYITTDPVRISSFEGYMQAYFYEGRLWMICYELELDKADSDRLASALDAKYGAHTTGIDAYAAIFAPLFEGFYHDAHFTRGDFYTWTAAENTTVILNVDRLGGAYLYYFNGNYIPTLHAAAKSDAASLFGL